MTSRIKAIRDRHRGICLIHSQRIHAIHTLYARTFPHRLMTYQVSYCIYIAATVEALELKSPLNQGARQAAAARLAAAVRILQNEASHTPGSGKSLDTIRRLLSAGQRTPGVPQDQNSIRNSDSTFVQHSIEDANANAELCTNLGDSNADEIPNGQPGSGVEPEVPIAAGAIQGQPEEGNGGVITGTVRQPTTRTQSSWANPFFRVRQAVWRGTMASAFIGELIPVPDFIPTHFRGESRTCFPGCRT